MLVEYHKRGLFGWLFKIAFVVFNLTMAAWLIIYWTTVSKLVDADHSSAFHAGAAIGVSIGTGAIVFLWVSGAIILGLLTYFSRGRKLIMEVENEHRSWAGFLTVMVTAAVLIAIYFGTWLVPEPTAYPPQAKIVANTSVLQTAGSSRPAIASSGQPAPDESQSGIVQASRPKPTNTAWIVTQEKSKIDDSTNVYLKLLSDEPIRGQFGSPTSLELWITCREKRTDLYIIFGGHFMSSIESYGTVTYRIDKRPAVKRQFAESTDHKALGLWHGQGVPLIKEMFDGSTLFVSATPYSESPVEAEFNISEFKEVVSPLRAACGWADITSAVPSRKPVQH